MIKIKDLIRKSWFIKLLLVLFFCIFLYILWCVKLQDKFVREEFIIEDGMSYTFTAPFKEIHAFGLSCDDIDSQSYLEENTIHLTIKILNKDNIVIWEESGSDMQISSFEISKCSFYDKMPVLLEVGESYSVVCESSNVDLKHMTIAIYGREKSLIIQYIIVCIISLFTVSASYLLLKRSYKKSLTFSGVIIFALLTILYHIILIPFSVQDEPTHFAQAYGISNIIMGKEEADSNKYIFMDESGLRRVNWCGDAQTQYRFWSNKDYGNIFEQNSISGLYKKDTSIPLQVYIVPAIGITLARLFHAPYQIILLSGRVLNTIFFVLLMALALNWNKSMQKSLLALFCFPSVVWLASSYSYDSWNFIFCVLLFSYCIYCRERESLMSWKDVVCLLGLGVLLSPIKFIYFIFSFCVLFIPKQKFKNVYYRISTNCVVIFGTTIVALLARGNSAMSYAITDRVDTRSIMDERAPYTIEWVIRNPLQVIKVYINTLFTQGENYLFKCLSGDFAGESVSKFIIYTILFLTIIIMMIELNQNYVKYYDRLIAMGIVSVGIFIVLSTFLFVYSFIYIYEVGTIAGVQGRYFLPFFCLLPLIINTNSISITTKKTYFILYLIILLNILSVICKFSSIIQNTI